MKHNQPTTNCKRIRVLPLLASVSYADFYWEPTHDEVKIERRGKQRLNDLTRLVMMKAKWEREDLDRVKRRLAEIGREVERDKVWLQQQEEWEREIERRRNYWLSEQAKEAERERNKLLARLEKANKEIVKSNALAERQELIRRGVYRGR